MKQNELMGLTKLKSVSQNNYFVNLIAQSGSGGSNKDDDEDGDGDSGQGEENTFTLFIPVEQSNSFEIEHKKVQMTIERHMIEIPVLTDDTSAIEVFHDSDSIMTLKRYLSTEHAINAILDLLEATVDDDSTLKCLRLLASILIQNKQATAELVNLDLARLTNLLASKLPEMHHSQQTRAVFTQLIEISCDELNCSLRIDDHQLTGIRQPALYQSRISFLQMGLDLVESAPVDQSIQFLEML